MDLFPTETARWIFAAWFTFLGAAVGSFLNVVVYRLPAGLNIAWPGSHCPRCKHNIRSYDNVPVLQPGCGCADVAAIAGCRSPSAIRSSKP